MSRHFLYLAKEPGPSEMKEIEILSTKGMVSVVACFSGYSEFYRLLGYNTYTQSEFFALTDMKFDVIIGNPPYGKNASLAVKFLNKAAELSDDIRMVLPRTFRKPSIINRLHPNLHLVEDKEIDNKAFRDSIVACIQHWEVTDEKRDKIVTLTKHDDFTFCKKEEADVCVGRVGGGPAGKVFSEWENRSETSHYFLKVRSPEVIERIDNLYSELRAAALETVGCPSLSKNDLIQVYTKHCAS